MLAVKVFGNARLNPHLKYSLFWVFLSIRFDRYSYNHDPPECFIHIVWIF